MLEISAFEDEIVLAAVGGCVAVVFQNTVAAESGPLGSLVLGGAVPACGVDDGVDEVVAVFKV